MTLALQVALALPAGLRYRAAARSPTAEGDQRVARFGADGRETDSSRGCADMHVAASARPLAMSPVHDGGRPRTPTAP